MFKRLLHLLFSITFIFTVACTPVHASTKKNSIQYIETVYEDGSYIEITLCDSSSLNRSAVTKSKTATYRDVNNKALWSITVKGTFTYNGSTSTCTNSSANTEVYSLSWKLSSPEATKSGATASASIVARQMHQDGTTYRTINKTVSLTCDKNGKFS